jgi:hypothetical protein
MTWITLRSLADSPNVWRGPLSLADSSLQKRPFTERLERVSLQSNLRGRRYERKHIAPQGKARITYDA